MFKDVNDNKDKHAFQFQEEYVQKWEETSKEVISTFLNMFGGREWGVEHFWNNSKRRLKRALSPNNSREGSPVGSDDPDEEDDDFGANTNGGGRRALTHDHDGQPLLKRSRRS